MNDVEPVLIAERRNNRHCRDNRFIERSTAEIPTLTAQTRNTTTVSNHTANVHHRLQIALARLGGEQIDQAEVTVATRSHRSLGRIVTFGSIRVVPIIHFFLPNRRRKAGISVGQTRIGDSPEVASGERIDFKRNPCTTAELNEHEALLKHTGESGRHGTRPVNEHHQPVILAFRQTSVAAEQILVELVRGNARHVKHASLGDGGALGDLSSLAKLKLLQQQIDCPLAAALVLVVHGSHPVELLRFGDRGGVEHGGEIVLGLVQNLSERHNDLADIGVNQASRHRQSIGDVPIGVVSHRSLQVTVEVLLSDRRRCVAVGGANRVGHRLCGIALLSLIRASRAVLLRALNLILTFTRRRGTLALVALTRLRGRSIALLPGITLIVRAVGLLAALGGSGILLFLIVVVALLLLAETEQIGRDNSSLIERRASIDASDERLLTGSETHTDSTDGAQLVVQVDAIRQRERVEIDLLHAEEILGGEFVVSVHEVTLEARELVLDQALNTSILNHVEVERCNAPRGIVAVGRAADHVDCGAPAVARSVQSVGDLMPDQHIVNAARHRLPFGQIQRSVLEVERCGRSLAVDDDRDVLGGENARHDGRGRVIVREDGSGRRLCHIVHCTGPGGSCQAPQIQLGNGGTSDNCTINNIGSLFECQSIGGESCEDSPPETWEMFCGALGCHRLHLCAGRRRILY